MVSVTILEDYEDLNDYDFIKYYLELNPSSLLSLTTTSLPFSVPKEHYPQSGRFVPSL